jgi:hypothetical protein
LKKENYDLRKLSFELQDRLKQQEDQIRMIGKQHVENEQLVSEKMAEREHEVQLLKTQLSEILASRSWKYLQPLRHLYSRFRSR